MINFTAEQAQINAKGYTYKRDKEKHTQTIDYINKQIVPQIEKASKQGKCLITVHCTDNRREVFEELEKAGYTVGCYNIKKIYISW